MKKLKKFVVLCLAVIMLFTACGKKGEEVTKELSITQMQTICELATLKCYYHNVAKLTKEKEVLWWDTSAELWIEYSGIVKLGVDIANLDMQVDGDQVTIDFDGSVDGKRFEGGKAEDYPLTIGSHTFIDNFEEQLIGKKTGEECEVNVTFPAEYHVEELKNKPAVFKVKVKEIQRKELPEANDDFASEVSDFDTMEEYKKDLTEKLQAEKIEAAKTADEDKVVAKVIENATMEIPDQMVEEQVNGMVNDYARRLESQGISFKQYVEITGMTAEKIGEQMKPQAIKRIQTRLVLEAVVKAENIQADDAAVEEQFDKMAEDFKMDKEQIKGMFGEEQMAQLKEDLAVQKAIDFLVAEAKFVD